MSHGITRPGGVASVVAVLVAIGSLYAVGVASLSAHWPRATYMAQPLAEVELAATLHRVGLDAESLAASGVGGQASATVVANAKSYLVEKIQQLRDADQSYINAKAKCDALGRTVRSGLATDGTKQEYAAAQAELVSATSIRESTLAAIQAAAIKDLGVEASAVLAKIKANEKWSVPVVYRAVNRTDADWILLRDCLANQRISEKLGEDPDSAAMAFLQTCDADQTVAACKSNVQLNLDAVKAAWDGAVDFGG